MWGSVPSSGVPSLFRWLGDQPPEQRTRSGVSKKIVGW